MFTLETWALSSDETVSKKPISYNNTAVAQSGDSDRFQASEERKTGHANRANRQILNAVIHCPHGLVPDCRCARKLSADKTRQLTEQQAK
ncbi:unnamed protein product, partial [Rotaria magnacalcarata]